MRSTIGPSRHASVTGLALIVACAALLAGSCGGAGSGDSAAGESPAQAGVVAPSEPSAAAPATASPEAAGQAAPEAAAAQEAAGAPSAAAPAAAPAPSAASATGTGAAPAPRRLGELVFAEGAVTLHRAGSSPRRADIGDVVAAYDVLATGPGARAEVDIGSGAAGGATVKLAENTAFYFDTKELDDAARRTVLQLLSGAVAIKVDRLATGSFSVTTDSAVLGVRGTVFIVDTVPDGSMLVSCDSGAVSVRSDGSTTTAKPGGVVELTDAGGLRLLAVKPEDLADYRGSWRDEAYEGFAKRALTYTSAYAKAVDSGAPALDAALARLRKQEPALNAWRAARAAGRVPRFTDWTAEKKAVGAALFDCLKAAFAVERPYYRLLELEALHEAGVGVGKLSDGRSSAAFFGAFERDYAGLALGLAEVREALALFSWASAGSPLGDFFGSKAEALGTGAALFEDEDW
ncbi:MAG TPA: FecR family protein [Spirochaetia bacterium]|nr:FecR family protein [Spirochaetales bacterium]HRW23785.1 FecR family protein [Spirochaetia bacterium]